MSCGLFNIIDIHAMSVIVVTADFSIIFTVKICDFLKKYLCIWVHFWNQKSRLWIEKKRLKLHAVGKNKLQSLDKNDSKSVHDISPQGRGIPQIYL